MQLTLKLALLATLIAATARAQTLTPTQQAPQNNIQPPQSSASTGCCGPITPAGLQLLHYLDSLNVDHLWPEHTFVDWRTGLPEPSNGHHEPPTHCSAFAAAAADRIGIELLHPPQHSQEMLAEAQEKWLESTEGYAAGWRPVPTPQNAQALANKGAFVVLVFGRSHGSGHIAIVRPAVKSDKALADEGPQTTQAGGHNFSSGTAKYSFTFHPGVWPTKVKIFAHATSFSTPAQ